MCADVVHLLGARATVSFESEVYSEQGEIVVSCSNGETPVAAQRGDPFLGAR